MPSLRLVMLGTGGFAEPTFEKLLRDGRHQVVGLVTQPEKAVGAKRGSTRQVGQGMSAIAEETGVPIYRPDSVNTPDGVAKLREWRPDLLVTAAYGQILKADVLDAARLGGINVHASLLPKYRGAAPVAWAIARGETETGVTIIRMTTGLDAGAMLASEAVAISETETAGSLEARLALIGARLALEIIDHLAAGPVHGATQDPALVTKAPKLTKEHGVIDWSRPADEICRMVRAMQPWPTAYTFLLRADQPPQRLLVLQSKSTLEAFGSPGATRASADGQAVEVAAGSGTVRILELQPAGKKRMTAAAFLNGRWLHPGDVFKQ